MKQNIKQTIAGLLAITLIAGVVALAPITTNNRSSISLNDIRTDNATRLRSKTSPNHNWFMEMVLPIRHAG